MAARAQVRFCHRRLHHLPDAKTDSTPRASNVDAPNMAEAKDAYFDPSKANMLRAKKEAKKNRPS